MVENSQQHLSPLKKRKTKRVSIIGYRVKRKTLLILGLLLFGIVFIGSLLSFFYTNEGQIDGETVNSSRISGLRERLQQGDLSAEDLTANEILQLHREATGLSGIKSLLLHGRYVGDERTFSMTLFIKQPNLFRQNLEDENSRSIAVTYDGSAMSVVLEGENGEPRREVPKDLVYQLRLFIETAFLALAPWTGEGVGEQMIYARDKDEDYDGTRCWTILSQVPGHPPITHLIDSETYMEKARYMGLQMEKRVLKISADFSEFRQFEDLVLPGRYELKLNGVVTDVAEIDSVQINAGVMPWLF